MSEDEWKPRLERGEKRYIPTTPTVDPRAGKGPQRCSCHFRIRGKRHDDGDHHNGTVARCSRS